jgi:signal peptidase I
MIPAFAWSYLGADPQPGDIVVFRWPPDPSVEFVKRVIATGDSTVEISSGVVLVNGKPIREPYLGAGCCASAQSQTMAAVRVPPASYFVMGDDRDASDDSRSYGAIPRALIFGEVLQ